MTPKIGLIAFANDSGLGNQTRRLAQLIEPHRLLVIDSSSFSKNTKQHFDWYDNFRGYRVRGFPTNHEVRVFLDGLTHVIMAENPLNFSLISQANHLGIKTYIQSNYEFCDHLNRLDLPLPTKFLMPSHWKVAEMEQLFPGRVQYLPPPLFPEEFQKARETNFARSGERRRFVHVVGTLAAHDRNGTLDLLDALRFSTEDYQLVIKSQHQLPPEYMVNDPRVRYQIGSVQDPQDLYADFDALILPRRYGGLSLTCNEALMAGLSVIMPNISPNSSLLPKEHLVPAWTETSFHARTAIDVYTTDSKRLGQKIDWMCHQNLDRLNIDAFELAYNTFSPSVLKESYGALWN